MTAFRTRLADIVVGCDGVQTGPFGSQLHADEYVSEGVGVIMPADMDNGHINHLSVSRVSAHTAARLKRHRVVAGDVLFSRRGEIGRFAVVSTAEEGWLCGTGCLRVRFPPTIVPTYAAMLFESYETQKWLQRHAVGQTMLNLNASILAQLPVVVRSTADQLRWSVAYEWHTGLRQSVARYIELKRTLKRGLTFELVTGKKRFSEFVCSNERQPTQFGTIPKDWSVVHISEIANEVKTRGEVEGAIVYSCTKHKGLVPSLEYFGRQVFSRNLDGYKRLQAGDFAYATNHIEEGSIGLLRNGQPPGLVSPMYTVFRPTERVNPDFLFALLKTESYRRVFEIRMSASIDRRGSLRWKEFSRIKIGLPTIDEQNRIAETLRLMDVEIQQLERLQELVELQKRALLSKLLSDKTVATS